MPVGALSFSPPEIHILPNAPPHTYIKEVAVRYTRRKLKTPDPLIGRPVTTASEVAHLFRHLGDEPRENLVVVHLDGRNRIARFQTVSVGTLTTSLAHPREIFTSAVITGSGSLILVHNHPSGDPSPSQEDDAITSRIACAGALLGIILLDHIVIGDGGRYFSYQERKPDLLNPDARADG